MHMHARATTYRAAVDRAKKNEKTHELLSVAVETGDASPIHGVAEMGFADYPAISGRQASASAA
jgi:hypothetical protein